MLGFPGGSDGKESSCNAADLGLIPVEGRSLRGVSSNPPQYSYLEKSRAKKPGRLQSMGLQRMRHD